MTTPRIPSDELGCRDYVRERLVPLAKEIDAGFTRYTMRPDVRAYLHAIATHYNINPLAAAAMARIGFISTVVTGGMNIDNNNTGDMPAVAKLFIAGYRLIDDGALAEMRAGPEAPETSEMTAALIEVLLRRAN